MLEHLRLRRANAPNTHITVRVLAAADHDGICAAHILSQLLDIRDVKHTLQPVWENADIAQHIKHVENDTEVLSMVLLNCGASTDLEKLVSESKAPDDFRCFVIDAHRPIAGSNLSKHNSRIIVLDDDPIAEARGERPPVDELDEDDDADELDEDSEDDKENEGSSNQTSSLESSERKRSRREAKEDKRRRKRQRIQEYYSLSYHAMPASMSMFHMAKQAKGQQNLHNVLWLAALGLLGYVELGLMGEEQYNKLVWQQLKEEQDFIRPRAPPKEQIHNFYRAYDAALCDRPGLFKEGVAQAVDIAKAVQTLARQIRDTKGAIKVAGTRKFRWTRIDQPPTVFRHPLAARKLVVWLSQTIFAYCSKRPHELPLLVVIRDGPMDSYLCVGITPPSISDVDEFGATFRHAVQATQNLQYRFDFFDKSCIAIAADDIDRFLTALTTR
ncbi:CDC45 [Symbiodinium sp. KB8]|nr:CDC45 [Symbiodinium sp. KB8]